MTTVKKQKSLSHAGKFSEHGNSYPYRLELDEGGKVESNLL